MSSSNKGLRVAVFLECSTNFCVVLWICCAVICGGWWRTGGSSEGSWNWESGAGRFEFYGGDPGPTCQAVAAAVNKVDGTEWPTKYQYAYEIKILIKKIYWYTSTF